VDVTAPRALRVGVVFPSRLAAADRAQLRAVLQAIEREGLDHVVFYDHVVGADLAPDAAPRPRWPRPPYTRHDPFQDPLVLAAFAAACTERIELVTGVLVLPQRPVALVARQAADVSILSGGRLRLGVAAGFNDLEFAALGQCFHDRGARLDAQLDLLRALWRGEVVTADDRWHRWPPVALNPAPVAPPEVWVAGGSTAAMRRALTRGAGWFPAFRVSALRDPDAVAVVRGQLDDFAAVARGAGVEPTSIGIQARTTGVVHGGASALAEELARWTALGVSHVAAVVDPRDLEAPTLDAALERIAAVATAARAAGVQP